MSLPFPEPAIPVSSRAEVFLGYLSYFRSRLTLERVLFHLLEEYARHVGHLDVVSELAGGQIGE